MRWTRAVGVAGTTEKGVELREAEWPSRAEGSTGGPLVETAGFIESRMGTWCWFMAAQDSEDRQ